MSRDVPLKLSVVIPVYNEIKTFPLLMGQLLEKHLEKAEIEIIIIESNSLDGTHEYVKSLLSHPRITIIFEEFPKGKGFAVRQGLKCATGDFILIQDGDLEYDINDYEKLLEPLIQNTCDFVLGARAPTRGVWRMREFYNQKLLSLFVNFGHWSFTLILNTLFGTKLYDPFTMYKVFKKKCIENVEFKCKYFDFDAELLVKLLNKGYIPLEVPINYRARTFFEGKKIRVFRDSLNLLIVLIRLKFLKRFI